MKKRQIFFLEQEGDYVYIRTHLDRYLTFKEDGKVSGEATSKGKDESLQVETQDNGTWLLKTQRGYFFGGTGEKMDAYTKEKKADRFWTVRLAMHPQVSIRSAARKRYVHLNGDQLTADEDTPWGSDATVNVAFFEEGQYALQANDGRYLSSSSELKAQADDSCKFILTFEFKQRMFAFRTAGPKDKAKYVTAMGAKGCLKASKDFPPTVDELFTFEDSEPQFKLRNKATNSFASIQRGIEVQCNQAAASDTEIFQFEIDPATKLWSLKTCKGLYWSCQKDGSIQAVVEKAKKGPTEQFTVKWMGPMLALKASNGNYVSPKKNGGSCQAVSAALNEDSTFIFEIINRPTLVLRGEFGFVASNAAGVLECNKCEPEAFTMHVSGGFCKISGSNGKFWTVGVNGVSVTGAEPDLFTIELVELSKFLIKAPNGKYLLGQQAGSFAATGTKAEAATLWEY